MISNKNRKRLCPRPKWPHIIWQHIAIVFPNYQETD